MNRDDYLNYLKFMKKNIGKGLQHEGISRVNLIREMTRRENSDVMEKYIDNYMSHLDEMLKHHEGKFTIFVGDEPLGFWDTDVKALEEGIKKYGCVPMLLREVSREYVEHGRYGKPIVILSRWR